MIGWLQRLFLDRRAREALKGASGPRPLARASANPQSPPPVRERDAATALAEAEDRMRRLPPQKAQLIRQAMAVHRASQSALAELSDEELGKLRDLAQKTLLGGR